MAIGPVGGGGSVAIAILAKRGFSVSAVTGGRHGPAQFGRPFILCGVCLYGIDSVICSIERRQEAWKRPETINRRKLAAMTREIDRSGVPEAAAAILAG